MNRRFRFLNVQKSGFSFLELLAALTILAIVVGIAAPAIFKMVGKGKIDSTKVQISALEQALNSFNLDCGFFPSTEQGLESLITAPTLGRPCKNFDPDGYLKKKSLPEDPWKKPFIYTSPGQHNASSYDLSSEGPDGLPQTADDINNWE